MQKELEELKMKQNQHDKDIIDLQELNREKSITINAHKSEKILENYIDFHKDEIDTEFKNISIQ